MNKKSQKKRYFIAFFAMFAVLFSVFFWQSALAATSWFLPACAVGSGDCTLCDMAQVLVNLANFSGGGVGAFALLFFMIGGMYWVFSGGNEERIKKGRSMMVNSFIGVAIIFLAWVIINLFIQVLTGTKLTENPTLFDKDWWKVECVQQIVTNCDNEVQIGTACESGDQKSSMECYWSSDSKTSADSICGHNDAACSCISTCEILSRTDALRDFACMSSDGELGTDEGYCPGADEACVQTK